MITFYDVSGVTLGNTPPSDAPNFQNAGLWHNYYCYITCQLYQNLGTNDPDIDTWLNTMSSMGTSLEQQGVLPSGSSDTINQIIAVIQAGESQDTYDQVIQGLTGINNDTLNNPQYNNTTLMGLTSIAYCSAVFNSQVTDNQNNHYACPKWLRLICADIVGGMGGSAFGPVGEVVGAVAGTISQWD